MPERRRAADGEAGGGTRLLGGGPARLGRAGHRASFEGSTRFAPDVNAITGRPSAMKTNDFTICATSQPIAWAASSAVFVPSGNLRIRSVRSRAGARTP